MAHIYSFDGIVPVIDPSAFVHPSAVIIGDVIIGPDVYVAPCASLRGDLSRIVIGRGSNIQDCVVLHGFPNTDTVIEEYGHIGHGAVVHGCTLRRNVLIGISAVIMETAEVGESAIVGASAFVAAGARIPARSLARGVPAKVVRPLTDEELDWKIKLTQAYVDLGRRARQSMVPCLPLSAPEKDRARCTQPDTVPLAELKRLLTSK
jgi:phenylacetic acid degradation protein